MPEGNRPKTVPKIADENHSLRPAEHSALAEYLRNSNHLDEFIAELRKQNRNFENLCQNFSAYVSNKARSRKAPSFKYSAPTHNFGQSEVTQLDKWAQEMGLSFAPPPAPESAASDFTPSEVRLRELQEIFWADVTLWELIATNATAARISEFLRQEFGLEVKPIPPAVWKEMVRDSQKREQIFELIGIRFACQYDPKIFCELYDKLPPELMGRFIWEYLREPKCNHRHRLACQELSPDALVCLRKTVSYLVRDVLWCQQNPGVIPPDSAPQPSHRQKEAERAKEIEKMVTQLLADPALSDLDLARTTHGISDSLRKMAREARRLVELREAREVHRYAENRNGRNVGRKPVKTRG